MLAILLAMEHTFAAGTPVDDGMIKAIAEGDKGALGKLYSAISGNVYSFALTITKTRHDADDVLQETFLRIYSSAGSYRPCGKPMAWVMTIAKNIAYDKLRARVREADYDIELPDTSAIDDAETRLLIKTLFLALDDSEKQIVILHAINGIKHREIANIIGIPVGMVLSKYNRAIKKMADYAKKESML